MSNNFYTDDIQTGRNVYVDKDLYESDESYKARIDSYVKEGFALIFGTPDNPSSDGGGGGASGMVVETEFVTDIGEYHDAGLMTTSDASDIINAITNGTNVVFHLIPNEEYSNMHEVYFSPAEYFPNGDSDTNTGIFNTPQPFPEARIESEKIFFRLYIE